MFSSEVCARARQSRDARFDGLFYVAVKSTGIYCRPICPAPAAKEHNVQYYQHAHCAAQAGFRPCIRCRPDSAPGSYAWLGTQTTAVRAKRLIDGGFLGSASVTQLADKLGITTRYLTKLFQQYYGIAPKKYALFKQCDLAKQLLQQTALPVTQVAYACGFNSQRRFNDAFSRLYQITPSSLRRGAEVSQQIELMMAFRPPYNWQAMCEFLAHRLVTPLEWLEGTSYGRNFRLGDYQGYFTAHYEESQNRFRVTIEISDLKGLPLVVNNIRRVLDLDADSAFINTHLQQHCSDMTLQDGLRLPGIWTPFEAGIRAVLGQQISVTAARNLMIQLVEQLGEKQKNGTFQFPSADVIASSDLSFFKMPERRKQAIIALAQHHVDDPDCTPESWLAIKGIGPWTVDYASMRGLSAPDIYLGGDLGVQKAIDKVGQIDEPGCAPFRSYLTFQLWQQLK
ncbi:AlkA N-terminal domain-containing protein [Pseudoalteromonas ardens]|uniref:DNA-3-methyladenine glycosylase II n=1 Tax=Pseudoalteromonas rubra TaxID=43658 RepID=A0A0L0ER49_9GAMM|nr:AlkA N-terminal domain-containing protein [Pseudoalteromonas sp. R96]KNC66871.1 ADA regulatory protein [Pseudoalteromonas rubra]MDK1309863.1 AlkA N-terminal domain-containing protein [Pseudoalteromonas sp. R96]